MPVLGNNGSDGFDLYAMGSGVVPPTSLAVTGTGLGVDLPQGYVGLVCSRSGFVKNGWTTVEGGVIDRGFEGPIEVILFNHGHNDLVYEKHDRIGQLLVLKKFDGKAFVRDDTGHGQGLQIPVQILRDAPRGNHGFGSTGK
jgi:dUTP pyrophosphatase